MNIKRFLSLTLLGIFVHSLSAQIQLTPYVDGTTNGLDENVKAIVENRLRGIISANGMNSGINTPFILAAKFNVLERERIEGPPSKIVTVLEFSIAIGNGESNQCFGSCSFEIKGIGETEQRAVLSALKNVKTKNPKIGELVKTATARIVAYYEEAGPKLIAQANALVTSKSYEEAISLLSQIPMECSHYSTAVSTINNAYQKHIDEDAQQILMKAKSMWATSQDENVASDIVGLLSQIDPNASCFSEANSLVQQIGSRVQKLKDNALAYERKMAETAMKNEAELEKARIKSARDIAVAYANNQPKVEYYFDVSYWW